MDVVKEGSVDDEDVPLRNAMNEVLRDEYVEDCQRGVDKWNRAIAAHGIDFQLTLPSRRFHRHIGIYADVRADPSGQPRHEGEWEAKRDEWLPSDADKAYVKSLMQKPIFDPKQMANWIAPRGRASRGGRSTSSTCVGRDLRLGATWKRLRRRAGLERGGGSRRGLQHDERRPRREERNPRHELDRQGDGEAPAPTERDGEQDGDGDVEDVIGDRQPARPEHGQEPELHRIRNRRDRERDVLSPRRHRDVSVAVLFNPSRRRRRPSPGGVEGNVTVAGHSSPAREEMGLFVRLSRLSLGAAKTSRMANALVRGVRVAWASARSSVRR